MRPASDTEPSETIKLGTRKIRGIWTHCCIELQYFWKNAISARHSMLWAVTLVVWSSNGSPAIFCCWSCFNEFQMQTCLSAWQKNFARFALCPWRFGPVHAFLWLSWCLLQCFDFFKPSSSGSLISWGVAFFSKLSPVGSNWRVMASGGTAALDEVQDYRKKCGSVVSNLMTTPEVPGQTSSQWNRLMHAVKCVLMCNVCDS